jgi:ribonuclease HI
MTGSASLPRPPKQEVHIFTDGSCQWFKNPKKNHGGWAFIVVFGRLDAHDPDAEEQHAIGDGENVYKSGYCAPPQTNNTMELMAVLEALRWVKEFRLRHHPVIIHSDSTYVIGGMESAFRHQVADGMIDPPNREIWLLLHRHAEACRNLTFRHVKGHAGHVWNEYCDRMANKARHSGMKA